jgi:hypothetical protein
MTLVIGSVHADIGFLVADTLLSYPVEKYNPRNPALEKFHSLKIHILTPDVAIAFAGDVRTSRFLIRKLYQELMVNPTICVPARLVELRKEFAPQELDWTYGDYDFLVLLLTSEERKLAKVTKDGFYFAARAYIGDADEYKNFIRLIGPYEGPLFCTIQNSNGTFITEPYLPTEGEQEFDQVSTALEKLTHQRNSETIGAICGNITRVVDARISRKLEYMQSGASWTSPWEGKGGFSYLASNSGTRGIGIYYSGWCAGLAFIAGDSETCRKMRAETLEQFIEEARLAYGLTLEGPGFNTI